MIYDYRRARLHLEPGKHIHDPFDDDMSGIRWVAFGRDRKRFRVDRIVPESPAARAGIAAGDVLISVDGSTCGDFERQWLDFALRGDGRRVKLVFERAGAPREFVIVLRRMV